MAQQCRVYFSWYRFPNHVVDCSITFPRHIAMNHPDAQMRFRQITQKIPPLCPGSDLEL